MSIFKDHEAEKNNAKQDIEKAIWYLHRYLETLGD